MSTAVLPQGIGHTAHIHIDKRNTSDLAAAIADGVVDLTDAQQLALKSPFIIESERLFRVADMLTSEQIAASGVDVTGVVDEAWNIMVNGGINNLLQLATGGTTSPSGANYSATYARICVGDGGGSVPTVAASDTTLAATSNRYNLSSPTVSIVTTTTLQWVGTFASGVANWAWNEWGIDCNASAGTATGTQAGLLNHKGVAMGTKASGSSWTVTAQITES